MSPNTNAVLRYLEQVQRFSEDAFAFVQPDVRFVERPNAINRGGQTRTLASAREGLARGKALLAQQTYDVTHTIESGDEVVVEAVWKGTLAIDAGPMKKGQVLEAFLCMVFVLRDGKIAEQRNYDCYQPLG